MHTRSELGSSPVTCEFRSSVLRTERHHSMLAAANSPTYGTKKTTALGPLPARQYCGNAHLNGNRVRLRAFACLPGASAVRAPGQARPLACAPFPAGGTWNGARALVRTPRSLSWAFPRGETRAAQAWLLRSFYLLSDPPVSWMMEREGPDWCRSCQTSWCRCVPRRAAELPVKWVT